jgi:hypothetical protein
MWAAHVDPARATQEVVNRVIGGAVRVLEDKNLSLRHRLAACWVIVRIEQRYWTARHQLARAGRPCGHGGDRRSVAFRVLRELREVADTPPDVVRMIGQAERELAGAA